MNLYHYILLYIHLCNLILKATRSGGKRAVLVSMAPDRGCPTLPARFVPRREPGQADRQNRRRAVRFIVSDLPGDFGPHGPTDGACEGWQAPGSPPDTASERRSCRRPWRSS